MQPLHAFPALCSQLFYISEDISLLTCQCKLFLGVEGCPAIGQSMLKASVHLAHGGDCLVQRRCLMWELQTDAAVLLMPTTHSLVNACVVTLQILVEWSLPHMSAQSCKTCTLG